jgi:hypothetical protein
MGEFVGLIFFGGLVATVAAGVLCIGVMAVEVIVAMVIAEIKMRWGKW